jgi:hypothetical protein
VSTECFGIDSRSLRFADDTIGKPTLSGGRHSGALVFFALGMTGLKVHKLRRRESTAVARYVGLQPNAK